MKNRILNYLLENKGNGKKLLAVLIDPDSVSDEQQLADTCKMCNEGNADLILVGGSLITNGFFEQCVSLIKSHTKIPVLLFPGSVMQISKDADAILFLSLISGRNADLLIGKHVLSAPTLKQSNLEILPTGYMLIDGGNITSVSYISNTVPIPADKSAIAATTAMAGEMLGLKIIYMDAGSGAIQALSKSMISIVSKNISIPLIIGGGINSKEKAYSACESGADIIVVGNAIETNTALLDSIAETIHSFK